MCIIMVNNIQHAEEELRLYKQIYLGKTSVLKHTNTARIRGFLSKLDTEKSVREFIFSRINYCNGVFTGFSKKSIRQLQKAAARVLTNT